MKKNGFKVKHAPNYSMFSVLPMNREIDSKHVQKMIESIKAMGIIRPIVACETNTVDGAKKTYILDGQHLATACERENIAIPYTTIAVKDEKDIVYKMALLNNSSKSWSLMDYVNAYKMYFPDYMKIFKWRNMFDTEPLMLAVIANRSLNRWTASASLKDGTFKVTNPNAEKMCSDFNEFFIKIGRADRWIKANFLTVFLECYTTYDHDKSLKNVDKHMKTLKAMADIKEAEKFIKKYIFTNKK